jgi:LPXTG-motif cell wall-anchored protein
MSYHDDGVGQLTPVATFRQTYVPPVLPPALTASLTQAPAPAPAAGGSHWMAYTVGGLALVAAGVGGFFIVRKMRQKAGSVATKNRR